MVLSSGEDGGVSGDGGGVGKVGGSGEEMIEEEGGDKEGELCGVAGASGPGESLLSAEAYETGMGWTAAEFSISSDVVSKWDRKRWGYHEWLCFQKDVFVRDQVERSIRDCWIEEMEGECREAGF